MLCEKLVACGIDKWIELAKLSIAICASRIKSQEAVLLGILFLQSEEGLKIFI